MGGVNIWTPGHPFDSPLLSNDKNTSLDHFQLTCGELLTVFCFLRLRKDVVYRTCCHLGSDDEDVGGDTNAVYRTCCHVGSGDEDVGGDKHAVNTKLQISMFQMI